MSRIVIFGATNTGQQILKDIQKDNEVIAFVDENADLWGKMVCGIIVREPRMLIEEEFDYVYVGVLTYYLEVMELLKTMKIPVEKIVDKYVALPTYARIEFLERVKEIFDEENIPSYAVAELGVYKGEFAKEINRVFPESRLYLFDTFEGFHASDVNCEIDKGYCKKNARAGYFADTSVFLVLDKMIHPENCVVRKGFFPDSAKGIEEKFSFVNIDADLYTPILAGLEWFYPRMADGGIILVHDYFSTAFVGAKEAVKAFAARKHCKFLPIGDTLSVALRINRNDNKEKGFD